MTKLQTLKDLDWVYPYAEPLLYTITGKISRPAELMILDEGQRRLYPKQLQAVTIIDLKQMFIDHIKELINEISIIPEARAKILRETDENTGNVILRFVNLEVDKISQIRILMKIGNITEADLKEAD